MAEKLAKSSSRNPSAGPRSPLYGYGLAALSAGAALSATLLLGPVTDRIPFTLFFAAVVVSTYYGGRGAGFAAVAASALLANYFVLPPAYSFSLNAIGLVQTGVFVFVASIISFFIEKNRRAEGRLRATEDLSAHLASIVESTDDAVIGKTLDGTVTSWNKAAERLYGYAAGEMVGRSVSVIIPPDMPGELPGLLDSIERGEHIKHHETVRRTKAGRLVEVSLTISPIKDAAGRVVGASTIARDIGARKRAEEALIERTRLAALGADVGAALIRDEPLPAMLQRCAETLVGHLGVAFARIWTVNEAETELELRASAGLYTHLDGAHSRVPVGEFKIGLIARERQPHLTNEVQGDPRVSDKEWARREGMVAFAGYPLVVEDRLVGVMAVFARRPLHEATLQAMASVANGIALGVERKRAESSLREQNEIIETVNRTGQLLAGELDLHRLVQGVTDAATELTGARFGSFFYNLLDEAGASYMLYTLSGVPREAFAHFEMPRATDLFSPTFRGEGTVCIDDVRRDPRYGKNSPYYGLPEGHLPVTSYLAVSVVSRSGEVLGGLFFGHPEAGAFTDRAARIVEGLASQTAVAMDNARLFEAAGRERAKAEASEEQYRFLAESIPQLVWTAQADGTVDYRNQRMCEYTGLARDGAAGEGYAQLHPDDVGATAARWKQALRSGERFELEMRMRRAADGSYRWHLARAVPLRDAEGHVVKWFGTSTDIDDRKRAEDSQRFLAEASEVLVSSLDYERTLARVAELVVPRLADWCAIDMLTDERTIRRIAVVHQDPAKVELARELERRYPPNLGEREGVAKVVRTGVPEIYPNVPDELLALVAHDAEHLRLVREIGLKSALVVPLVAQGRVVGAITLVTSESGRRYSEADLPFVEDLAHRAALAIENARLYQEAQEVNRLKDEFLATLSHELRTPLTAVLGWTRLLATGQLDEATSKRAMDTIERNAQSQVQLIDDILDVSRIIRGKLRLEVRPVELAPVIESAVETVRPAAEAKGIRLQLVLDPLTGPVSGDPDRLQQIIWNLLSNAIKFTPKDGRVQVLLARADSHLEVTVSDSGQGIEAEFLPFVFDRFRQADPTTTRTHGGLGLGLAIVRHLTELHGGTVRAESAGDGGGATFRVTLPLLAMQPAGPTTTTAMTTPSGAAGSSARDEAGGNGFRLERPPELADLRVLVVEDDADSRDLLIAVLRQCGAEVLAVSNVAAALDAFDTWRPQVLISDIEMPGEDGYALIRQVRARPPELGGHIPAAALTAYARAEDRMRALLAGFQMHVPKPVEPAELAAVVASLAGRTNQQR